ncbi:MAG: hypothetical protein J5666_03290 [Bacilli bacterium]|nr:hypothetical protein [Bacilli bacterium]
MKKKLFLIALFVLCLGCFVACGKEPTPQPGPGPEPDPTKPTYTVTYNKVTLGEETEGEGEAATTKTTYTVEVLGTEKVEEGSKISGIAVTADGSKYLAPKYFLAKEVDLEETAVYDAEKGVTADLALYAEDEDYAYYQDFATGTGYTLNYSITDFPITWNSHVYETNTDSLILGYSSTGFYEFDYNDAKDGYKWVDGMAVGDPKDVTAQYVGEEWGIEEDDKARAWEITIREDLCWDDGTPITSEDFVQSAIRLLNPKALNGRADDYTYGGNFIVHNAEDYLKQGSKVDQGYGTKYDTFAEVKEAGIKAYLNADLCDATMMDWQGVDFSKLMTTYRDYYLAWFTIYDTTGETPVAVKDAEGNVVTFFEKYNVWNTEDGKIELTDEMFADYAACLGWNPDPDGELGLLCSIEVEYPAMTFDKVGIIATAPNKIVYIIDEELSGFYLKYSLSTYLVKTDVYDACDNLDANGNLPEGQAYTTTYCTDATNSPSYGPYKLVAYQLDKYFKLEKNTNWWGYKDAENAGLYQTTAIVYTKAESAATRLQMFLSGKFDSYGLQPDDMDDYQDSKYTYFTDGDSTWFIALNPNLEAYHNAEYELKEDGSIDETKHKNIDKEILSIKEFRMALSFALDRAAYELACDPTGNVAKALFSPMIISDPENGTVYRNTQPAKEAIVKFWGLDDQIGDGKLYATIDDAIDSITGYNLAMAKSYFTTAYNKAKELGYIDDDDVVEILIGTPNLTSNYYNKGYDFLTNCYTDAVKGTPLEGKLTFKRDGTLGGKFGDYLRGNKVDMLFGVGWTGSALDPYGLVEVYTTYDNRYNAGEDFTKIYMSVELPAKYVEGAEAGDTVYTYTATAADWTNALKGKTVKVTRAVEGQDKPLEFECSFGTTVEYAVRGIVLAGIELCALEQYEMIPIAYDSSAALKSMKVEFYTEEYIYGVGRGGVKYMKFNYNDSEWAAFVASKGGKLNYKVSDAE